MSNTKPDFSRDPERVALAKVLREAVRSTFRSVSVPNWETMDPEWKREYLFMADAAITHLGSGYRLPEATEANAERLARVMAKREFGRLHFGFDDFDPIKKSHLLSEAAVCLRDMEAAFAEPTEKPEPVFLREDQMRPVDPEPVSVEGEFVTRSLAQFEQAAMVELCDQQIRGASPSLISVLSDAVRLVREYRRSAVSNQDYVRRCPATLDGKRCNLAVHADDVNHDNGETSWMEAQPLQKAQQFEPRKMDATERGERRRERQKLVWEAMMAIGSSYRCTGSTAMGIAITYVDNYLAWRDADTAKDTEAYRCTK